MNTTDPKRGRYDQATGLYLFDCGDQLLAMHAISSELRSQLRGLGLTANAIAKRGGLTPGPSTRAFVAMADLRLPTRPTVAGWAQALGGSDDAVAQRTAAWWSLIVEAGRTTDAAAGAR